MLHMYATCCSVSESPLRRLPNGRNRHRTGVFLEVTEFRHRKGQKFAEPCIVLVILT